MSGLFFGLVVFYVRIWKLLFLKLDSVFFGTGCSVGFNQDLDIVGFLLKHWNWIMIICNFASAYLLM